jgi:putative two-component system response regulator
MQGSRQLALAKGLSLALLNSASAVRPKCIAGEHVAESTIDPCLGPVDFDALLSDCVRLYYAVQPKQGLDVSARGIRCARTLGDRASLRKMLTAQAILQAELHNLPQAFETCSEILDLCNEFDDAAYGFSAWNNISGALAYAEFPRLAVAAARVALEYAERIEQVEQRQVFCGSALTNLAYGCLFTKEYGLGLRTIRRAIGVLEPQGALGPSQIHTHLASLLLALTVHGRLLLRVNKLDEAEASLRRAEKLSANEGQLARTRVVVEMSCALLETYCGDFDLGVARLVEFALSKTLSSPVVVADALRDLAEAYLVVNRPQLAAEHLRHLGKHMQQVRSEIALFHHRRHTGWLETLAAESRHSPRETPQRHPLEHTRKYRDVAAQRSQVLEDLCAAAELHDDSSGMHPHRVAELARALAAAVGVQRDVCEHIAHAAKLHDVGKVAIPPAILCKPGLLNDVEIDVMRSHTTAGAEILASAEIEHSHVVVSVARHHHEWWSGAGYPDGLSREEIPLAARITAVAESFDAMTHARPYRQALSVASALQTIEDRAGHQFDPALATAFCSLVREMHATYGDLDSYLERGAKRSAFLQARERFKRHLVGDRY